MPDKINSKLYEKIIGDISERYRELVEGLPAITYIAALDVTSTTLYVSPQIETIIGITPEEYKSDRNFWINHIHPEDKERVLKELEQTLNNSKHLCSEYRMFRHDGKILWIRDEAKIIYDKEGSPLCLLGVMYNITEEKKTQQLLSDSHSFTRKIVETTPIGIVTYLASGECISANKAASDIIGTTIDNILHQNFRSLESWKTAGLIAVADEALSKQISRQVQINVTTTFGRDVWLDCTFIPFESEDKPHLLLLVSDVTEEKNAKDALQKAHNELEKKVAERTSQIEKMSDHIRDREQIISTFLDTIPESMFMVDKKGAYLVVNRVVADRLGKTKEELLGQDAYALLPKKIAREKWKLAREVMRTGRPLHTEDKRAGMYFENYLYPVPGREGGITRVAILSMNVTDRKKAEEGIKLISTEWKTTFDSISDPIMILDTGLRIIRANQATGSFLKRPLDAILGNHCFKLMHGTNKPPEFCPIAETMKIGRHTEAEAFFDNLSSWFWVTADPVFDETGKISRIVHTLKDITKRKLAEDALKQSEERFRLLAENAPEGIFIQTGGRFAYVNREAIKMFGAKSSDQLLGQPVLSRIHPDCRAIVRKRIKLINEERKESASMEQKYVKFDGTTIDVEVSAVPFLYENQNGALVFFHDISDRKKTEKALKESEKMYRELSTIDALTQLYNSRFFYKQMKMEIDRASRYEKPLTLIMLDIDDFKQFNDKYGHIEGDKVLMRLGHVINKCLRKTDSAYRYGGEEFTVVLPMTRSEDGLVTAERIRTEFKKEMFTPVTNEKVHETVSLGVAQFSLPEDMTSFVNRADQCMYKAKKNGKDRVCCWT